MASTINGNAGAGANGAIVTATLLDSRGAILGTPQQTVVGANGAYSFSGLVAGTYLLKIAPPQPNPSGAVAPLLQTQVITQPLITVDGSSTYAI